MITIYVLTPSVLSFQLSTQEQTSSLYCSYGETCNMNVLTLCLCKSPKGKSSPWIKATAKAQTPSSSKEIVEHITTWGFSFCILSKVHFCLSVGGQPISVVCPCGFMLSEMCLRLCFGASDTDMSPLVPSWQPEFKIHIGQWRKHRIPPSASFEILKSDSSISPANREGLFSKECLMH